MTPRQLAQEVENASRDRRHDDVQRYLARLVQLAEQGATLIPTPTDHDVLAVRRARLVRELASLEIALGPVPHHPV